jgi:acetyl-CoA C-acetyltransferase
MSERRDLARCAGFARAGERAFSHAGLDLAAVTQRELYSCFPSAVRVQLRELGIADGRPPSVSGGMTFAGGPLNHFVLQALVRMAEVLRGAPGVGLLTAVSGILIKQGVSLWASEPGAGAFAYDDVSEATGRETPPIDWHDGATGDAVVATYTVLYEAGAPRRCVLLCDLEGGGRTLVASEDAELARLGTREELCGRSLRISPGGGFHLV